MHKVLKFFNFFESVNPRSSALYNILKNSPKEDDEFFHLSIEEYSDKISCSPRQLQRCIKSLSDCHLIERDYRSHETGNRLYVKVNKPPDDKNMQFNATFDEIEVSYYRVSEVIKRARIKNVYNYNYTISLNWFWIDYNKDNEKFLESLAKGDRLSFEAEVVKKESKFNRWYLKNIRNLRK